jgi:DNA repair photolyase
MQFTSSVPACPVACKYCFITEHDTRREVWNKNPVAGINKACTFINVTPWIDTDPVERERFSNFPWEVLEGDFVGFTAITDPFFPKIEHYLWEWVERATSVAKLTTCVTKWPINRRVMKRLSRIPNFFLVVGITGNEGLERVSTRKHLETLALAKELGVRALPISHPYIAGVSNLDFLPALKRLGYDHFDVKGLRYCEARMGRWMPEISKPFYQGHEEEEILPEDGWRQRVADAGLDLLSPREWYLGEGLALSPHLSRAKAVKLVERVFELANVVSSDSNEKVFNAAVERRL